MGQKFGCIAGAYRATPNETTTLTPNLMLLGREIRIPSDVLKGGVPLGIDINTNNFGEQVSQIRETLHKAHEVARKHLQSNAKRRKDYFDRKSNLTVFNVNDKVWYQSGQQKGLCSKLQPMYTGPYLVTKNIMT